MVLSRPYAGPLLLLLLTSGLVAGAPPTVDVELLSDAALARLDAAETMLVVGNVLSFGAAHTDAGELLPLTLDAARCFYVSVHDGERAEQEWQTARVGTGWNDMLTFLHQSPTERQQTVLTWHNTEHTAYVRRGLPPDRPQHYLFPLGMARPDASLLLSLLQGTKTVRTGQELAGQKCVVVEAPDGELFLDPEFDHAPLRLVRRRGDEGTYVTDWWAYRRVDGVAVPQYCLSRSVREFAGRPVMYTLGLTRWQMSAFGERASNLFPSLEVPLVVGAVVAVQSLLPGDDAQLFGATPYLVWSTAEADGAPWKLSIRALAEDLEFRLPDRFADQAP